MTIVNPALVSFFSAVLLPFRSLAPGVGLTVISFLSGILFLFLFKKTSNQKAIRTIRDGMRASMLEIRLFQHDLGVVFRAQGRILFQTAIYLRYSLAPIVFICAPLIIIAIHCNMYFGFRQLRVGEAAIVSLQLRDDETKSINSISLGAPPEIGVETPPVFLRSLNRVEWRVRAKENGVYKIVIRVGDSAIEKKLVVAAGGLPLLSPVRPAGGLLAQLANPAERPIPVSAGAEFIRIAYPPRDDTFFGWRVHWLIPFFILTLVFGYAFKGFMGVEI